MQGELCTYTKENNVRIVVQRYRVAQNEKVIPTE